MHDAKPMRHLDPCTCGGTMRKYCTRTKGKLRTRYLKCDRCTEHGQEVFRIDDRGRPIFLLCTPPGIHVIEHPPSLPNMTIDSRI